MTIGHTFPVVLLLGYSKLRQNTQPNPLLQNFNAILCHLFSITSPVVCDVRS